MANSRLPKLVENITILGSDVEVSYQEEVIHEDGTICLGMYDSGENKMYIKSSSDIPYDSQLSTLLHECIEAIDTKLEMGLEHRDISTLEAGIFQLLRDNPQLCKAFTVYKPRSK